MTSQVARLLLARHGQTDWHRDNRYAGAASDIGLTDVGREQAAALADFAVIRQPQAVVCSPLRRAMETARPAAAALGVPLQVVDELREVTFGLAEGRTAAELDEIDPEIMQQFRKDPVANAFPGAEPPAEAAARAATALRSIAAGHPGQTVLVVAHNTLLRLALCAVLDVPVSRYRQLFPRLDNAAITELWLSADAAATPALISLNVPVVTVPDPALPDRPPISSQPSTTLPTT